MLFRPFGFNVHREAHGVQTMTRREMNLNVFRGEPGPQVFFQPRIEPWFAWNKQLGKLPEEYQNMHVLNLYDALALSMRYPSYYTEIPEPIERKFSAQVQTRTEADGKYRLEIITTPYGDLVSKSAQTPEGPYRTVGFPVQGREDFKKLEWLCENTRYEFSLDRFAQAEKFLGDRGVVQFSLPRSPYQALCQQWMTYEQFIYALFEDPGSVRSVMDKIDASYDSLYEDLLACGRLEIVGFGENIDCNLLSPKYFEAYLLPFYEKRSNQLREAGIFTHVHIDGSFRPLLKYLKDLPFDGLEALTPKPMGDVSIDEIKAHIGEKILLDGIPAVLFMSTFTRAELEACVQQIVEMFSPRLVLGISDEMPMAADAEGLERVRWVSEYCRQTKP